MATQNDNRSLQTRHWGYKVGNTSETDCWGKWMLAGWERMALVWRA